MLVDHNLYNYKTVNDSIRPSEANNVKKTFKALGVPTSKLNKSSLNLKNNQIFNHEFNLFGEHLMNA